MSYVEYKREFMREWTRKIARAAGVAEGRGKRGTLVLEELLKQLYPDANDLEAHAHRTKWMRWKAGQQTPSLHYFQKIHIRAVKLGYIGQGKTLRSMQERAGMMSEAEWEFWQRYETNPAFEVQAQEQELQERLVAVERQIVALEREAAAIRRALSF